MSQFGCIKDKFDERDYLMRAYLPAVRLPKRVDYSRSMTPVRDQGEEGTCVGFAVAVGMKEYQECLDYRKWVGLSPRFIYSEARKIDGLEDSSEGTTVRAAMQVLKKLGVCQENLWPYSPHQMDGAKSGFKENAKKFRVLTYARILNLAELRLSLAGKGPVVIGIEVFKGMMDVKGGLVPMPKKTESSLGGHAVSACGYDDSKKLIKFKNSWSVAWGDKGYGYLPYAYIDRYMMDAWSTVDIEDPNPLTLASVLSYKKKLIDTVKEIS